MNKNGGFTLMELMIAVAIVAILAVIAVPSYQQYLRRANRTDATKTITLDAQALERCYSQAFSYVGCAGAAAGTLASPNGKYNVTISVPDPAVAAPSYFIKRGAFVTGSNSRHGLYVIHFEYRGGAGSDAGPPTRRPVGVQLKNFIRHGVKKSRAQARLPLRRSSAAYRAL